MRTQSGRYVWLETLAQPIVDETGVVTQLQTSSRDVTERIDLLTRLEYEANHDLLTGLPNRKNSFCNGLTRSWLNALVLGNFARFLFLDLDRFKVINDSLGHLVGDQVLVAIAQKLKNHLTSRSTVARLSGDEFIILLEQMQTQAEAQGLAEQLLAEFGHPLSLADWDIFISASIGIVGGASQLSSGGRYATRCRDCSVSSQKLWQVVLHPV